MRTKRLRSMLLFFYFDCLDWVLAQVGLLDSIWQCFFQSQTRIVHRTRSKRSISEHVSIIQSSSFPLWSKFNSFQCSARFASFPIFRTSPSMLNSRVGIAMCIVFFCIDHPDFSLWGNPSKRGIPPWTDYACSASYAGIEMSTWTDPLEVHVFILLQRTRPTHKASFQGSTMLGVEPGLAWVGPEK